MSEETVAQRMAASLGVSVEAMRAAMEAAKEHFAPPEESLCGEEEALAAGLYEEVLADVPPSPPGSDAGLQAWAAHCRTVGRSRTRAYAEALSLVQAQFEAWRQVFPGVAEAGLGAQGRGALTDREKEVLAYYSAGFAAFLRDTLAVVERGGR